MTEKRLLVLVLLLGMFLTSMALPSGSLVRGSDQPSQKSLVRLRYNLNAENDQEQDENDEELDSGKDRPRLNYVNRILQLQLRPRVETYLNPDLVDYDDLDGEQMQGLQELNWHKAKWSPRNLFRFSKLLRKEPELVDEVQHPESRINYRYPPPLLVRYYG